MKKFTVFITTLLIISASNAGTCVVNYHIRNYPDFKFIDFIGEGASVVYFSDEKGINKDGTFSVEINEPTSIMVATSHYDPNKIKFFWLHDGNIDITIDSTGTILFKNSPLNEEFLNTRQFSDSIMVTIQPLYKEKYSNKSLTKDQIDSITIIIDSINSKIADHNYNYYLRNTKSFLALDYLSFYIPTQKYDRQKLEILFNSLDTSLYKYPTYKNCVEALALKHKPYKEGDTIDYLPLTDKKGKLIDFKSLLNGKYIYINNWASGCAGCGPNNEKLVKAYKKLKNKVEFIGISGDSNKDSWLRAIKNYKIKWQNFCDFKGMLSIPDILLHCYFIPNGTFVSPSGKILSKNMEPAKSAEEFIKQIKQIMNNSH